MIQNENLKPTIDFVYNPDNQTKSQLIDSFVVRLKTFERLFSDIKTATMKSPEQHYLIEGKRGMGKTTLLLRLAYEIENEKALNKCLIPIVFNEEEYSIRRLFKLWERIAKLLEEKDSEFAGLFEEMDETYDSYNGNTDDYEYAIFKLLNSRLEEKGKKLILFIDNFGDIFQKFNKQEVQRFRTVLQSNVNFRLFGASSTVLEAFHDNKHPFFELFKVSRLHGLNKKETQDLLLKLGAFYKQEQIKEIIETQPGRVEALRRLTGGVIRTIVLLSDIFIDQKQGSAFSDLEAILDRVTPLYKHRMDDLPAQQQEIVEAIAFSWDAISVHEISQKTKIISKTVSAQLRQMEKNEIITKKLTNNKNHFYQVSERFFNIWYLMRHGRKGDKRKVLWLVRFLEEWCDSGELMERARLHIGRLKAGRYDLKGAYYLTEAMASTGLLPQKEEDELIKTTRDFLSEKKSEFVEYLSASDLEVYAKVKECDGKKDYKSALDYSLEMRKTNFYNIGLFYAKLKDFIKSEEFYLKAIEKGSWKAMTNLGLLYATELRDVEKAELYYLKGVEKGDSKAMNNLGVLYATKFKDFEKAKLYYSKAVEKGLSLAMNNLAALYKTEFNDNDQAEFYYLKAIEKGNSDAIFNLVNLYYEENREKEKSIKLSMQSYQIQKNDLSKMIYTRSILWNNKITESKELALEFLYDDEFLSKQLVFRDNFLFLLLAKNQYQFLYDYFTSPKAQELNIKDQLKPIWYALMHYMQEEHPNEYLRMGEELEETVKEIIAKVEQMRIDYA